MNRRFLLIVTAFLVAVIAVALSVKQAATFHLISTSPRNGQSTNQYTAVSFSFNQPLAPTGQGVNQITITPNTTGKTAIFGKTITFTPDSSYQTTTPYKAILKGATNNQGKRLGDITISFTPQYIPYDQLPDDVKKRLISQTDINDSKPKPYSVDSIAIAGSSELIDHGLADDQLNNLRQAFFGYFQQTHQEVKDVSLSNIYRLPHDRNSDSTIFTMTFTATFDGKASYAAKLDYFDLTNVHLYLSNPTTGAVVYDSGVYPR